MKRLCLLLFVFTTVMCLVAWVHPVTPNQDSGAVRAAIEAALSDHAETFQLPYDAIVTSCHVHGDWAYANCSHVYKGTANSVPTEPFVVLARRGADGAWEALAPSREVAREYNSWLEQIPPELISVGEKAFIRIPGTRARTDAVQTVVGYKLPWSDGWGATLTQRPQSSFSHTGMWAWDFDLWQGQWDGMVGESGHVVAAKGGKVIFAKDVSNRGGASDLNAGYANVVIIEHGANEYSWYYHLEQNSIPLNVKEARREEGQEAWIEAGTVIGIEGSTGWSTATHLHFMVTDGVPDLSTYDENEADQAPWLGGNATLQVDFDNWDGESTDPVGKKLYSTNYLEPRNGVVLYWDADYKGPSMKFTCDQTGVQKELPRFLKHQVSSIKVSPEGEYFAALYSDINSCSDCGGYCRGWWWTEANFDNDYCDPKEDPVAERTMNDAISSIKITSKQEYCSRPDATTDLATNVVDVEGQFQSESEDFCGSRPTADNATFLADITLPDGTVVSASQALVKTWRMKNTGTTTWGSGYELVFVGGEQMGAPSVVSVIAASPGQEVDIGVSLTAPTSDGDHVGYWRLRNAQGTYFGPTILVRINVQTASDYVTTLTADPPSPSDASSVRIHARVDNFPNFRAMRLKIDGNIVHELGAPEFYYNWNTSGYAAGDHSIVVEVADQTDTSWSRAERRSMTYTLLGNTTPVNHVPNRPNPSSPYDWYVYYSGNTGQLCAAANGDPDGDAITGYYFEIYDSPETWNSGWVGTNCVTTSALGPYTYQWRVKVRDSRGAESEWSDAWHFTLVNPSLSISELYFEPQDGVSEQVKIRACTTGQGGVGITMRVSANDANDGSGNGTWHIIGELGVPCFNAIDAPMWRTLEYGDGPHRVRVEAHGSDVSWDGATVREEVYTLPHRRPAGTRLVAPVPLSGDIREAIYLNSRTITFRWEATVRATTYTLHISTSPSPRDDSSPVFRQAFDSSVTQHTVTFDQDYPTLYWQVSATNDMGANASGDQLFGIDRAAPSGAVQPLPGTTYESVFQVSWSGSDNLAGIRTFDIQYLDSGRGTWSDWLTAVPSTKIYELFTGQPGHTYAFRSRATDNANNTGDYPDSADTSIKVDPAARPPEPWWDSAYSARRNVIVLNNMSSVALPGGYPVHLHFDNGTTPTAAEIYNASQSSPKCNDLRIVYNNATELGRVIQNCSTSAIDIWFRTQVSIPAGSSDSATHQLYYGNASAGAPPAESNQVWYPYREGDTEYLYFFQEGSGLTAYDSSGNARHASMDASVQWAASKFGNGLRFNRANAGDSRSLNCGSVAPLTSFTIEFWYKTDPGSDDGGRIAGALAGGGNGGGGNNWLLQVFESRIRFDVWPCGTCGSSEVRSDFRLHDAPYVGNWNHIAVTFNGGNEVKFYINGGLDSTKYLSQSGINTFTPTLEIGSSEGIGQVLGNMGAFRIASPTR